MRLQSSTFDYFLALETQEIENLRTVWLNGKFAYMEKEIVHEY